MLHTRRSICLTLAASALCSLMFSSSTRAAEFDAAKLQKLEAAMQKYVDTHFVAGVVAAVGSQKGIVYQTAAGDLNVEQRKKMSADALFRIASMTKPVTAMGLMILADEGKLSIDDPVEKYLPVFKGQLLIASRDEQAKTMTLKKSSRPITLRDLATHTSGLPGGFPEGIGDLYFKRNLSLAEAVCVSSQRPLDFEPGSKWAYCNAGIDTLGRVIEVVSGQSYESFLAQRIFQPLGMKDTSFYPTDEQLQRLAGLYGSKDGKLEPIGYQLLGPTKGARHPIPAGGLYSTAADLAKLYQVLLNQGTLGETKIISAQSLAEMTKVQTGDLKTGFTEGMGYGLGFAVTRTPAGVHEMLSAGSFGHGGAFGTQGWIDPHQDLFVILLFQRVGLPNADGSDIRRDLQKLAVEALKK
jgi:CubicO group peptidase (beta-lactamase class C family)